MQWSFASITFFGLFKASVDLVDISKSDVFNEARKGSQATASEMKAVIWFSFANQMFCTIIGAGAWVQSCWKCGAVGMKRCCGELSEIHRSCNGTFPIYLLLIRACLLSSMDGDEIVGFSTVVMEMCCVNSTFGPFYCQGVAYILTCFCCTGALDTVSVLCRVMSCMGATVLDHVFGA